jgi:predicted ATP-grasp superfamily ATP-dependent carboligase
VELERRILIVGASARAAAFSALRAGFQPWCADLFADADLRARCPVQRLSSAQYPKGFLDILRAAPPGPWLYTGALENHRALIRNLARSRPLWGNSAEALALVRSPETVHRVLAEAQVPCPAVRSCTPELADPRRWLVKPFRGGGGAGIRLWDGKSSGGGRGYFQEYVKGQPCSALFVGDGLQACLLGVTRQLVGVPWLYAGPFRYCGSIGPWPLAIDLRCGLERLGSVLTRACRLRGLFGVDCIVRDCVPFPVEINPRYTASVEVLEYATGLRALAFHRQVFDTSAAPHSPHETTDKRVVGKAILFARTDTVFPSKGPWSHVLDSPGPIEEMPAFADLPVEGQPIRAGQPILTYFARAESSSQCLDALQQIAADLDRWLFSR